MNTFLKRPQFFKGPAMPILNGGSWNPALHPRDPSNGEFTYAGGGRSGTSVSKPNPLNTEVGPVSSAIRNALNLPIDKNTDRSKATAADPSFSHYGYADDSTPDTNSNKRRLGNHNNTLNSFSLSISLNVVRANRLKLGKPVYVNGKYLGNYDDSPAPWVHNTIDIYDPNNHAGTQNWGGMLKGGARISSSP